MRALMVGADVIVIAEDGGTGNHRALLVDDLAHGDRRLISRLPLAFVLAVTSVLIPGHAGCFLEAPLDWSDLLPTHRRSRTRMATEGRGFQSRPRPSRTTFA
jgi:hypothetical protein